MFSQALVILFTGGVCQTPPLGRHPLDRHTTPLGRHLLRQTPPQTDTPRQTPPLIRNPPGRHPQQPLQWTVRILLECILVELKYYILIIQLGIQEEDGEHQP